MNANELVELGEHVVSSLAVLWDHIGVSESERAVILTSLKEKVEKSFQDAVSKQDQEKKSLEASITTTQEQIAGVQLQLKKETPVEMEIEHSETQPLRQQNEILKLKLSKLEAIRTEQVTKFEESLSTLHSIWDRVGYPQEKGFTETGYDITDARLNSIYAKIEDATKMEEEATQFVQDKCAQITALIQELDFIDEEMTPLDVKVLQRDYASIGVHVNIRHALTKRVEKLEETKQQRQERLTTLAQDIIALWDRLSIPKEESDQFLADHEGLGIITLRACESELQRLLELKQASLKDLIPRARERLFQLWEETFVSDNDRKNFAPAFSDQFTDETLESHEREIKALEARADAMRPLLKKIEERRALIEEKVEFDVTSKDPARFKIAGRMIYETKFLKRWNKKLPSMEKYLAEHIPKWVAEHGPFIINGEPYTETLAREQEERAEAAVNAKIARGQKIQAKKHNAQMGKSASSASVVSASGSRRKKGTTPASKSSKLKASATTPSLARSSNKGSENNSRTANQQTKKPRGSAIKKPKSKIPRAGASKPKIAVLKPSKAVEETEEPTANYVSLANF